MPDLKKLIRMLPAALFIVPLILSAAHSQETLKLGGLIKEARANNQELKALHEMAESREAAARAQGALEDPALKIEMEDLDRDRPLSVSPGNAMMTRYTISQSFPFPGKLSLREKIAFKGALGARFEAVARELEVVAMVKQEYFEYAFLSESIRINEGIKGLLSDAARVAESRYSTGQAPQQDLIKINIEQSMLTNELLTLNAQKDISAARLKSILNRPQDSPLGEPEGLPKGIIEFDTAALIGKAASESPDIKMAESEAEANELGVNLAKKNYYPDIMLGVAPIQRDGRFDSFDVMLQFNIPIWRGKYGSLEREAASSARSARSRAAFIRAEKGFEVKSAAIEAAAAQRARELFETGLLPQSELSFESALKNYQTGRTDLLTVLDTERVLRRTRIEHLRSVLEYNKKIAALERASGVELAAYPSDGGTGAVVSKRITDEP